MSIGERLKQARGEVPRTEYAAFLGVHRNTLGAYERDERPPDAEALARIAERGVDINWLLTGEGQMRIQPNQAPVHADMVRDVIDDDPEARRRRDASFETKARRAMGLHNELQSILQAPELELSRNQREAVVAVLFEKLSGGELSDFVEVPLYNVEAAAGHGALVPSEEVLGHYAFRRDFIQRNGWSPEALALVTGRGDSMPGVVEDGQLVLVNLAETEIAEFGVYLLRLDDHLMIKAAQVDHKGTVYIRSTNSMYREITVPKEERDQLIVVGRAVWTDRLL